MLSDITWLCDIVAAAGSLITKILLVNSCLSIEITVESFSIAVFYKPCLVFCYQLLRIRQCQVCEWITIVLIGQTNSSLMHIGSHIEIVTGHYKTENIKSTEWGGYLPTTTGTDNKYIHLMSF